MKKIIILILLSLSVNCYAQVDSVTYYSNTLHDLKYKLINSKNLSPREFDSLSLVFNDLKVKNSLYINLKTLNKVKKDRDSILNIQKVESENVSIKKDIKKLETETTLIILMIIILLVMFFTMFLKINGKIK